MSNKLNYSSFYRYPEPNGDNVSILNSANNHKVDMVLLEQCLLKIVQAQRALPLLSLVYLKEPTGGRF